MEIHNSRFEGDFKAFGEAFAQQAFFDNHRVFSAWEVRRMQDVRFALIVGVTALSTYFNRDDELEDYLRRFNDEFMRADLERELDTVIEFIDAMRFPPTSRLWKKADLFSAVIELHSALYKRQKSITAERVAPALTELYSQVDDEDSRREPDSDAARYYKAALQATNERSSRITRGEILRKLPDGLTIAGVSSALT